MHPNAMSIITLALALLTGILMIVLMTTWNQVEEFSQVTNIYVIRTHKCSTHFMEQWDKVLKELPNDRLYVIFDNTSNNLPPEFHKKYMHHIIVYTEENARRMNPLHMDVKSSVDTSIELIYSKIMYKPFDYLWLIEDDVFCHGNWYDTLSKIDTNNTDFLATYVEKHDVSIAWVHWEAIHGDMRTTPMKDRVKSFFPLTRYSRRMLECAHAEFGKSSGFCEVYFPTLANKYNLTFDNIDPDIIGAFLLWEAAIPQVPAHNKLYHKYTLDQKK